MNVNVIVRVIDVNVIVRVIDVNRLRLKNYTFIIR